MITRSSAMTGKVMNTTFIPLSINRLHRKYAFNSSTSLNGEYDNCSKINILHSTRNYFKPNKASPIVREILHSPGQAIDPPLCNFMPSSFGHDFSRVRVHRD
jgi:hypothetical protein